MPLPKFVSKKKPAKKAGKRKAKRKASADERKQALAMIASAGPGGMQQGPPGPMMRG